MRLKLSVFAVETLDPEVVAFDQWGGSETRKPRWVARGRVTEKTGCVVTVPLIPEDARMLGERLLNHGTGVDWDSDANPNSIVVE